MIAKSLSKLSLVTIVVMATLIVVAWPRQAHGLPPLQNVLVVNTTLDEYPPMINSGNCTLREAIIAVNTGQTVDQCSYSPQGVDDLIEFNVGAGTPLIDVVAAPLPPITHTVTIDGSIGSGGATRVAVHVFQGDTGFRFTNTAPDSAIRHMVINGTGAELVKIEADNVSVQGNYLGTNADGTAADGGQEGVFVAGGPNAHIGGTNGLSTNACTGDCNLVGGNQTGVYLSSGASPIVQGNWIGLNASGTGSIPNSLGIHSQGPGAMIGGTTSTARNVISGNDGAGINLTYSATIEGNYIGLNPAGTSAIPNGRGVELANVTDAQIGGPDPGAGNVISGNSGDGIIMQGSTGIFIRGNMIGTRPNGSTGMGNTGNGIEFFFHALNNVVGGQTTPESNVIAFNGGAGVLVDGQDPPVTGNSIRGNSIHSNAGMGIENVNGGNNELAPPVITDATAAGATGTACANCYINVYSDSADEGRFYAGLVQANVGGDWTFTGSLAGPHVTATASDAGGNTSEFSAPFTLPVATPTPSPTPSPTHSPTPTPSPTPTVAPGQIVVGDIDCDGDVDTDDMLVLLEAAAGLIAPPMECAQPVAVPQVATAWGDLNCDGKIDGVDALMIVLQVAGFHRVPAATGCPEIGTPVV